jgi:hypothetical protein
MSLDSEARIAASKAAITAAQALKIAQSNGEAIGALTSGLVVYSVYTASSGQVLDADTSTNSWTLTLPEAGGTVVIRDHASSWGINPLTVNGNGAQIAGQETFLLNAPGFQVTFAQVDGAWRYSLQFLNGAPT